MAPAAPTRPKSGADPRTSDAVFLLDGHSLAYRAFFALPSEIATSDGFPTNALYGFAAMLVKVLADFEPRAVICTWDGPGKTFRHAIDPEYKAGRATTPDLFRMQLPHFQPLVSAFGYRNVVAPQGVEADDLIAVLSRRLAADGQQTVIVTGDRDAFQLVDDLVSVLATARGVTDTKLYGPEEVRERYGIGPELVPDFIALKGDTSDNIPGAAGIGEKTAAQLLNQFGDLAGVMAHADEIPQPKRRENLLAMRDPGGEPPRPRWERNLELARARLELDPGMDPAAVAREPVDTTGLRDLLRRFEFASLLARVEELGDHLVSVRPESDAIGGAVRVVGADALAGAVAESLGDGPICTAVSGAWWALCAAARGDDETPAPGPAPVPVLAAEASAADVLDALGGRGIVAHNWKAAFGRVAVPGTSAPPPPVHDTEIAQYLLEPQRRGYVLADLCEDLGLGVTPAPEEGAPGLADAAHDAAAQALRTRRLAQWQGARLGPAGLAPLLADIELPLTVVLAEMERTGIAVDRPALEGLRATVRDQVDDLSTRIAELAPGRPADDDGPAVPVNLGSPQQLAKLLYTDLGLPAGKRGKTGYSTDQEELLRLAALDDPHPIVGLLLEWRELSKLLSSQLDLLPAYIDDDDRIRTTFVQTAATTGRLSSNDPNLQAIPVRTEIGRRVRACFVASPGARLVSCDYSQIELRVLAHVSGERTLRDALAAGEDVHAATASEVFKVPRDQMTKQIRERAKAVNFGIMYGISGFGLARQLAIGRDEAQAYIEAYLNRFPAVQAFIEETHARAAVDGFVTTLFGRRRPIPEIKSRATQQRQLGQRLAVNTIIQGSAADLMKLAMISVHGRLAADVPAARLTLTIHDELVIEAPAGDAEATRAAAVAEMADVYPLDPPLTVDAGIGATWLDAG